MRYLQIYYAITMTGISDIYISSKRATQYIRRRIPFLWRPLTVSAEDCPQPVTPDPRPRLALQEAALALSSKQPVAADNDELRVAAAAAASNANQPEASWALGLSITSRGDSPNGSALLRQLRGCARPQSTSVHTFTLL